MKCKTYICICTCQGNNVIPGKELVEQLNLDFFSADIKKKKTEEFVYTTLNPLGGDDKHSRKRL